MKNRIFLFLLLPCILTGCGDFGYGGCSLDYEEYDIELWAVNVNSGALNPVYTDWPSLHFQRYYSIVGISENGSQIYYVDDSLYPEIKIINLNSLSEHTLGIESYDERVELSPDGQKLVYQKNDEDGEIWIVSSDGSDNTSLAINEIFNSTWNPIWLGDSNTILFNGYKKEESGLYLFNIEQETLQKLTPITQRWRGADITPDGSTLVYRIESGDEIMLHKKNILTGVSTKLNLSYRPVLISPDGNHIVYSYASKLRYLNLSNNKSKVLQDGWFDGNSVGFSSNGEELIFENSEGLALVKINSLNKAMLVNSGELKGDLNNWDTIHADIESPTFTKDGKKIFFFVSRYKFSDGCPD